MKKDSVRQGKNSAQSRQSNILGLAAAVLVAMAATATSPVAHAATAPKVINVHLRDATDDPGMAGMKIVADQESVPAGPVQFLIVNDSKSVVHELLIVKVTDPKANLPYDEKTSKVLENKLDKVVDTDDIKPGGKKTVTVSLKTGDYMMICNQAGHFAAGMRASLTVTK